MSSAATVRAKEKRRAAAPVPAVRVVTERRAEMHPMRAGNHLLVLVLPAPNLPSGERRLHLTRDEALGWRAALKTVHPSSAAAVLKPFWREASPEALTWLGETLESFARECEAEDHVETHWVRRSRVL